MPHILRSIGPTSIELELDGGRVEISLDTPERRTLELVDRTLVLDGTAGTTLELELDAPAFALDELNAWLTYCPIAGGRVIVRVVPIELELEASA